MSATVRPQARPLIYSGVVADFGWTLTEAMLVLLGAPRRANPVS